MSDYNDPPLYCWNCGSKTLKEKTRVAYYDNKTGVPQYELLIVCQDKSFLRGKGLCVKEWFKDNENPNTYSKPRVLELLQSQ